MVAMVVVIFNGGDDLLRDVVKQAVVFEQDTVFQCLMPMLDFFPVSADGKAYREYALSLYAYTITRSPAMSHCPLSERRRRSYLTFTEMQPEISRASMSVSVSSPSAW